MKIILLSLLIFLTIGLTIAEHMLNALNIDANYLFMALIALIITQLTINKSKLELALVIIITLLIAFQPKFLIHLDINREVLLAGLVALVITPYIYRLFRS